MKRLITVTVLVCLTAALPAQGLENSAVEPESEKPKIILMKPRFVEGEVGKPAIIIIPRASLLDNRLFNKSYHNDIIRDLYLGTTRDISEIEEKRSVRPGN